MNLGLLLFYLSVFVNSAFGYFPLVTRNEKTKQRKENGCWFGSSFHSSGSSWHPNLGKPFGIMYCIRCNCVKDNIGRKYTSPKVFCHDVRKDCRPVKCKNAKVEAGECCPSCPEDDEYSSAEPMVSNDQPGEVFNNDDASQDLPQYDKSKRFIAIATGEYNNENHVIRSSFEIVEDDLHLTIYSASKFLLSELFLTYINENERIAHKIEITDQDYVTDRMICTVWRNLSSEIIDLFGSHQLQMNLKMSTMERGSIMNNNWVISGPILTHISLYAETFNALLTPKNIRSNSLTAGASVIITLGRNFKNINFVVLMANKNSRNNKEKISVALELLSKDNDVLRTTRLTLHRTATEFAGVWKSSSEILKSIGRGTATLQLSVNQNGENSTLSYLQGEITPRVICNGYGSILSGSTCTKPNYNGGAGRTLLHVNMDGTVMYDIKLEGLKNDKYKILLNGFYRKRKTRVIEDLSSHFNKNIAHGKLKSLGAKELHIIQTGAAFVTVIDSETSICVIAGKINEIPSPEIGAVTAILSGSLANVPSSAAGEISIKVTDKCTIKYAIDILGININKVTVSIVGVTPTNQEVILEMDQLPSGETKDFSTDLFYSLNEGTAHIQVATKRHPSGEIKAILDVPNNCYERKQEDTTFSTTASKTKEGSFPSSTPQYGPSIKNIVYKIPFTHNEPQLNKCLFDGIWREEESTWSPKYDAKCTRCFCKAARSICKPVTCPKLNCQRPVVIENSCCPICEDFPDEPEKNKKEFYPPFLIAPSLADVKPHKSIHGGCKVESGTFSSEIKPRGATWNPVIQPFGTIKCVKCSCTNSDRVVCDKLKCPPVNCKNPVLQNPSDCCRKCPEIQPPLSALPSPSMMREDWMLQDSPQSMCHFGTKVYPLGHTWHAFTSGGRKTCVQCTCERNEFRVYHKCRRKC